MSEEKHKRPVIGSDDEDDEIVAPVVEETSVVSDGEGEGEGDQQDGGLDDLFGDDDNGNDDDDGIVHDSEDEDAIGGARRSRSASDDQFLVAQDDEERELRVKDEDLVRHPPKFAHDEDIYLTKIPRFLHVDPSRFDAGEYMKRLERLQKKGIDNTDELTLKRLHDENTIRWRYTKLSNETLTAESNAQFVEWEDGSFSLKLGDEYFDVLESSLHDTFLATYDPSATKDYAEPQLYLADGSINKTMKFVPTSTNSRIHKKLTSVIQSRQQTKPGAQSVVVEVDPEKESRRLEKQFEDKVRERRRQQLKLEREQEKGGVSVGSGGSTPKVSRSYGSGSREQQYGRAGEEYDDEDGFIDDEDDSEEGEGEDLDENLDEVDENVDDSDSDDDEAAERLKRVKEQGAAQYDDAVRKKRRVIEDSDDE